MPPLGRHTIHTHKVSNPRCACALRDNQQHNPSTCISATTTVTTTVPLSQKRENIDTQTRTRLRTDIMKEMENYLSCRYKINVL